MDSSRKRASPDDNIESCISNPELESDEKRTSIKKLKSQRRRNSDGYKSLPQNQCPSVCRVCNNPAIGYHYEIPSCNGCKIFFRRAILNGTKLKCAKTGTCLEGFDLADTDERVCRACRLKKCIEVGMNPLAIRAEAKSVQGKVLREELLNQVQQRESKAIISSLIMVEEDSTNRVIRKLTQLENKIEPLHRSGVPAGFRDIRKLEEILDSPLVLQISKIPNLKFCPHPCYTNKTSQRRFTNYVHSSFLASIEYSKMFDFSSQMDLNSKLLLIKHTTVVCSNMMDAFFSMNEMKSDKLLHPDGSGYGEKDGKLEQYQLLQKTLTSFISHRIDRIEYMLFKAIMLCNPVVPDLSLSDQQCIEKERNQVMKTLFNYCLLQHGKLHGPARFSIILAMAPTIENQSKNQKDLHLYLDAEHYQEHKELGQEVKKCISYSYDGILES